MKKLLFITWDGPQTSYMEGLFMPIFHEISKKRDIEFHVLQFTWGDKARSEITKKAADKLNISYTALPISRKPIASVGSFFTLFTSLGIIKKYIKEYNIDIVMPRNTFPAYWGSKLSKVKQIYDSDGLQKDERVDFAGLKKNGIVYRWMQAVENSMFNKADAIITRSQKSIDIHISNIGKEMQSKFSVVYNGRDSSFFTINTDYRNSAREELKITDDNLLLGYAGSLGPQYCLEEMLQIFRTLNEKQKVKFLILTGNTEFAKSAIPHELSKYITVKKVPFEKIPYYLNAIDIGLGLRMPSYSMQGVAPIKLGEYLLCGIPVIASRGIGDSEDILKNFEDCYLFDHSKKLSLQLPEIIDFVNRSKDASRDQIRKKALEFFSLEAAAKSYINALDKVI